MGGAIDVRQHDVPLDACQDTFDLRQRGGDGGHAAIVAQRDPVHLTAPRADDLQRVAEGEHSGGDQGRVLAQAVADYHVRDQAIALQQAHQGHVHSQHGGLGDDGVLQLAFGLSQCGFVAVHEDVVCEGTAQQGLHHLIGFAERRSDDGVAIAQLAQHVDVL